MPVMQTVNGYVCQNCTDVANARKGVDPAHPKDPPHGAESTAAQRGPAVTFGGELKQTDPVRSTSATPFTMGTAVNITA